MSPYNIDSPGISSLFAELTNQLAGKLVLMSDKPEETLQATLRALWLRAAGIHVSAEKAGMTPLPRLNAEQAKLLRLLLSQRLLGVPLAHLTGRQRFMGLEFICSKDALIPRKETEILANASIELLLNEILPAHKNPLVLDLCCGCGNVAVAIAAQVPSCTVIAADLSVAAVELGKQNAREHDCSDRIIFFAGDLFAPVDWKEYHEAFDLITCNPPYISTGKLASMPLETIGYEPKMAFDGGPLGAGVLWRLLDQAPRFLKPGGWLSFESGLAQAPGILKRLSKMPQYINVQAVSDHAGNPRTILGARKQSQGPSIDNVPPLTIGRSCR